MADLKKGLPQGGTTRSSGGESSAVAPGKPGAVSPTYSGGDKKGQKGGKKGERRETREETGVRGVNMEDIGIEKELRVRLDRGELENVLSTGRYDILMEEDLSDVTGSTLSLFTGSEDASSDGEKKRTRRKRQRKRSNSDSEGEREGRGHEDRIEAMKAAVLEGQRNFDQRLGVIRATWGGDPMKLQWTADALRSKIEACADIITVTVKKCGNLKGTTIRDIKDAVEAIRDAADLLKNRSVTKENTVLAAKVASLEGQVAGQRAENQRISQEILELRAALKDAQVQAAVSPSTSAAGGPAQSGELAVGPKALEQLEDRIARRLESRLDTRLARIEERLPPVPEARPTPTAPAVRASGSAGPKGKGRGKATAPAPAAIAPAAVSQAAPIGVQEPAPAPRAMTESWVTVARRGAMSQGKKAAKKPAETKSPPQKAATAGKRRKPRLRPPRSAAVVLSLQPGAAEKGVTYAALLREAKEKVSLESIGITELHYRQAITGARILELPGAASGDKADSLAEKLREVLPAEVVQVSRPVKTADLRIVGLDDTATPTDVVAAVARYGGCAEQEVKAGEVRRSESGNAATWVRCPMVAAKKLQAEGRLRVGWVSAHVTVLDPKPMRCYRCLLQGHVGTQCKSAVDRSLACFRCGGEGHKAAGCTAPPHCVYCAAAGRPANHAVGSGKACSRGSRAQARAEETEAMEAESGPSPPTQSLSAADAGASAVT
ncbi:uncharacterized protein LOC131854072 [Achroia grisella]|uniref:uncharacterized protein LOC131854072 n=1 Tax=Achroia grisella TaxID=688607 RepID=UPI0027D1F9AF|nr:uncharacterized protein LOC131854072 [Achroia grisella]